MRKVPHRLRQGIASKLYKLIKGDLAIVASDHMVVHVVDDVKGDVLVE